MGYTRQPEVFSRRIGRTFERDLIRPTVAFEDLHTRDLFSFVSLAKCIEQSHDRAS